MVAMPQAIQIGAQSKQQSLPLLHAQRTTRRTSREFALYRTEQTLDQSATPIELPRKRPPHLGTNSAYAPGLHATLGGDHTLRPELLPDIGMIPLAVEFGVGQHQADARLLGSRFDRGGQIRAIVPRTTSRDLRQQELLIQIRHDHPFQPMSPGQWFLPVMMHPPHEKRADRSLCQARGIDRDAGSSPAFLVCPAQPAHRFAHGVIDGHIVQTLQKAIQGREVGHAPQPQRLAQFAMLAQPHFGFAKGPVFVAHQAENGQQLGLVELVLAETASVTREPCLRDLQGDPSKRQEPTSAIVPPAEVANNNFERPTISNFHCRDEDVNSASRVQEALALIIFFQAGRNQCGFSLLTLDWHGIGWKMDGRLGSAPRIIILAPSPSPKRDRLENEMCLYHGMWRNVENSLFSISNTCAHSHPGRS